MTWKRYRLESGDCEGRQNLDYLAGGRKLFQSYSEVLKNQLDKVVPGLTELGVRTWLLILALDGLIHILSKHSKDDLG